MGNDRGGWRVDQGEIGDKVEKRRRRWPIKKTEGIRSKKRFIS
jgi:hypothetical protein